MRRWGAACTTPSPAPRCCAATRRRGGRRWPRQEARLGMGQRGQQVAGVGRQRTGDLRPLSPSACSAAKLAFPIPHPAPLPLHALRLQVAALCESVGQPLDFEGGAAALSASLAAAAAAAPSAVSSLIKSLATRAMSEAEYFCTGGQGRKGPEGQRPERSAWGAGWEGWWTWLFAALQVLAYVLCWDPSPAIAVRLSLRGGVCVNLFLTWPGPAACYASMRRRRDGAGRRRHEPLWAGAALLHTLHLAHKVCVCGCGGW